MAFKCIQLVALLGVAFVASCSASRTLKQGVTPEPSKEMANNKFTQAQQDALTAAINGDSSGLIGDQSERGDFVQIYNSGEVGDAIPDTSTVIYATLVTWGATDDPFAYPQIPFNVVIFTEGEFQLNGDGGWLNWGWEGCSIENPSNSHDVTFSPCPNTS